MRLIILFFLSVIVLCSTGCPDYSHLREPPDYKHMTDSGAEAPER